MYSIDIQRHFPNQETWFLQATLLEDGRPFAQVNNSGTGGSHTYQPINSDYEAFRLNIERFNEHAASLPWEWEYETNDQYVETLLDAWFNAHTNKRDLLAIGLTEKDLVTP